MQDPAERESKVKESVEKAKEAVAMDVKDGISWSTSNTLPINISIDSSPSSPPSLFCPSLSFLPLPLSLLLSLYSDPWECVPLFVLLKSARLQDSQAVCLCLQPGGMSLLPPSMTRF